MKKKQDELAGLIKIRRECDGIIPDFFKRNIDSMVQDVCKKNTGFNDFAENKEPTVPPAPSNDTASDNHDMDVSEIRQNSELNVGQRNKASVINTSETSFIGNVTGDLLSGFSGNVALSYKTEHKELSNN